MLDEQLLVAVRTAQSTVWVDGKMGAILGCRVVECVSTLNETQPKLRL